MNNFHKYKKTISDFPSRLLKTFVFIFHNDSTTLSANETFKIPNLNLIKLTKISEYILFQLARHPAKST